MGTPDIGKILGHYYSLFPPGASFIAFPFFAIGMELGNPQLFVFSVSSIFSLLIMLLMVQFAVKLKLHWSIALFAAIAFGFATNAWGYSVTFYAHLISGFFLLLGLYLVSFMEKASSIRITFIWLLYAIAVFVDFPNLFLFFPIALFSFIKSFHVLQKENTFKLTLNPFLLIGPFLFATLMGLYGYYNYHFFGSPMKFSNGLPRVQDLKEVDRAIPERGTETTAALKTRLMLEGFHSFTISDDRGLVKYSPVVLLFIFGLGFLKKRQIEILLFTIPAVCITLYSMFSDPYGGWAFGSRYMIASLPELCLLAGIGLQRFAKNNIKGITTKIIYSLVFIYSTGVALLAPLTTNVIPPRVEGGNLGLAHDYSINWRMLSDNQLNSFFYNHILHGSISGFQYYYAILTLVLLVGLFLIWYPKKSYENTV